MSYVNLDKVDFKDTLRDAFGRLRTSNVQSLFDSKQLHDKLPLLWDEEISGGTSTHSTTNASTTLSVSLSGEHVIRQTKQRFNYAPGKSQLIFMTFTLNAGVANVTKRLGYFNSNTSTPFNSSFDGIYLEQDGTTLKIVVSKSGTKTEITQSNWNIDKFDGTGKSGITFDVTKSQILFIDFEWLGTGRVRIGFVLDGVLYTAHEFLNANEVAQVYISSPNHSARYEIRSTGGSGSLEHICTTVLSEGGETLNGIEHYVSTAGTHVDLATENQLYAILGVRLKSTELDQTIDVQNINITLQTASSSLEWILVVNPTIAGTFTYSGINNSSIEYATGTSTNTVSLSATNTLSVNGGYISTGGGGSAAGVGGVSAKNALKLGSTIAGVSDELVLCARPIDGSTAIDVEGSLAWNELS